MQMPLGHHEEGPAWRAFVLQLPAGSGQTLNGSPQEAQFVHEWANKGQLGGPWLLTDVHTAHKFYSWAPSSSTRKERAVLSQEKTGPPAPSLGSFCPQPLHLQIPHGICEVELQHPISFPPEPLASQGMCCSLLVSAHWHISSTRALISIHLFHCQ
jgi:hypothetical protein